MASSFFAGYRSAIGFPVQVSIHDPLRRKTISPLQQADDGRHHSPVDGIQASPIRMLKSISPTRSAAGTLPSAARNTKSCSTTSRRRWRRPDRGQTKRSRQPRALRWRTRKPRHSPRMERRPPSIRRSQINSRKRLLPRLIPPPLPRVPPFYMQNSAKEGSSRSINSANTSTSPSPSAKRHSQTAPLLRDF